MTAPIVLYTSSFDTLLQEHGFTLGALLATPEAAPLQEEYETFTEALLASNTQDAKLLLRLITTNGVVKFRDVALDGVTDLVLEAILAETKGSYAAPLYKHFAGDERPSVFKRPILGKQLEKIRAWPASLEQSSETLQLLQGPVSEVVQAADQAVAERDQAQEERSRFRAVGDRKKLVDQFNGLRERLFTALVAIAKSQGEASPESYARSFFATRATQGKAEAEAKLAQLQAQREEQLQALVQTERQLAEITDELEVQRAQEATREAALAELAAAEQALAEAKRKATALRARKR
jgi:hypothetical protein